jgi:flagellar biogenesis protein FliO
MKKEKCRMKNFLLLAAGIISTFCFLPPALAQTTNSMAVAPLTAPALPDVGPSVLRVMGALVLVIGIFLGGVWLFRNWQRLALQRGGRPKLNIVETRSLGGRQALYVVGYEQGRFLIASSPSGVSLLSHLPDATADETPAGGKTQPAFSLALAQILKGK